MPDDANAPSDEPAESTPPRRPRFRVRYSLRAFLLVVTLACLWLGYHTHGANRQRLAVEAFRDYGGWVHYDYQFTDGAFDPKAESWAPAFARQRLGIDFFHAVLEVNCVYSEDTGRRYDNGNIRAAPLEHLAALPRLTGLFLLGTQANDENLRHVVRLNRLKRFYVWDAVNLTDEGVAYLGRLKTLSDIHLSNSQITDESLRVFAGLPNLEDLSLQYNRFTDDGVAQLATLERLETLWVCGKGDRPNPITDASLEFLFELPQFNRLGVQHTDVTPEFMNRVESSFPKCSIAHHRR